MDIKMNKFWGSLCDVSMKVIPEEGVLFNTVYPESLMQ